MNANYFYFIYDPAGDGFVEFATADYFYFIYDPAGDGFVEFATAEERDARVEGIIGDCLTDDEWDGDVTSICVGIITGRAERVRGEQRPPEEELDENDCDEDGTHWPDGIEERFDVAIVPTLKEQK